MVGILDLLTGNDAAASPWGMLYQQQDPKLGFSFPGGFSPFPDPSQLSVAAPPVAANQPSPLDTAQYPAGPIGAPPTFGAGATPFSLAGPAAASPSPASAPAPSAPELSFADRFAPALEQPLRQMAARPATDLSSVNRPGSASAPAPQDQAQPIPVGQNYQMPRFGSADDFEPDDATPANAKPTQGALPGAPPQAAPFSLGGAASGVGDRLGMAARGFMGNLGAGPIGALMAGTGSLLMGRESDPTAIAQGKMNATAQALMKKGASADEVQAAAVNPELMKTLISQYYGKDKWHTVQVGEDGMGRKTYMQENQADGTMRAIPGAPTANAGGGVGDMSKTGAAYLATVPTQQAQIIKGMVDGTIQPPSSFALAKPMWQAMIAGAKNYDPAFDENLWAKRHKMSIDLASSGNSSMGGILSNGKSAFEHLATYSGKLADVGNYNGPDVPGGAAIADVGNFVGNRMLPRAETLDKIAGANSAGLKYGQESTKFYAGSGGGADERLSALHSNDARSTTAAAQAGFLQTEKELMLGRLREKENQIRDTFGDAYLQQHPVFDDKLQKTIAIIDGNIAKLRGTASSAAPAPAAARGTVNVGGKPISWSVN